MAVTVEDLKKTKHGDYIEASGLYYKILGVKAKGIELTDPFPYGSKAEGKWSSEFNDPFAKIDFEYWTIIKAD